MRHIGAILPDDTHTYRGDPWVTKFYLFLCLVITFRSMVHVFRKDGGAASIAGIDLGEQVLNAHPARDFPTRMIGD